MPIKKDPAQDKKLLRAGWTKAEGMLNRAGMKARKLAKAKRVDERKVGLLIDETKKALSQVEKATLAFRNILKGDFKQAGVHEIAGMVKSAMADLKKAERALKQDKPADRLLMSASEDLFHAQNLANQNGENRRKLYYG